MAFINIDICIVFLSQFVDLIQWGDISIHRENSISDDDPHPGCFELLQLLLQVSHVQVFEASLLRLAQPDTIDDRCMIEGVTDDRVLRSEDSLEEACICVESTWEEDGIFK